MRTAAKKIPKTVLVMVDPKKGARRAIEQFARTAARLRDNGKADTVSMPVAMAAALAEAMEDIEDIATYDARVGTATVPHEVVGAMIKGVHPVRAWRAHRGLTIQQLAASTAIPVGYISEIETRKKPGSVAAYKALAKALDTDIDSLVA